MPFNKEHTLVNTAEKQEHAKVTVFIDRKVQASQETVSDAQGLDTIWKVIYSLVKMLQLQREKNPTKLTPDNKSVVWNSKNILQE